MNKGYTRAMLGIPGGTKTNSTLEMGALHSIRPLSLYAESSATFGHAAILRDWNLDEVLASGGDRCFDKYYFNPKSSAIFPEKQGSLIFLKWKGLGSYTDGSKSINR